MSNVTAEQVTAAISVAATVGELIRERGSIPNGELYALLMGKMDLSTYNSLIGILKETGLVKEENHLLIWDMP